MLQEFLDALQDLFYNIIRGFINPVAIAVGMLILMLFGMSTIRKTKSDIHLVVLEACRDKQYEIKEIISKIPHYEPLMVTYNEKEEITALVEEYSSYQDYLNGNIKLNSGDFIPFSSVNFLNYFSTSPSLERFNDRLVAQLEHQYAIDNLYMCSQQILNWGHNMALLEEMVNREPKDEIVVKAGEAHKLALDYGDNKDDEVLLNRANTVLTELKTYNVFVSNYIEFIQVLRDITYDEEYPVFFNKVLNEDDTISFVTGIYSIEDYYHSGSDDPFYYIPLEPISY